MERVVLRVLTVERVCCVVDSGTCVLRGDGCFDVRVLTVGRVCCVVDSGTCVLRGDGCFDVRVYVCVAILWLSSLWCRFTMEVAVYKSCACGRLASPEHRTRQRFALSILI